MKSRCTVLLFLVAALAAPAPAQAPQPAKPADIYHVSFFKSAPAKSAQLGAELKSRGAKTPMPGHFLVLRHQLGDDWDYMSIEHIGAKATVDVAAPPPPAAVRDLVEWHDDTFVGGPAWAEFARAMGIADRPAANTAGWVYEVAVHRALPGHRDQLEKILREPPGAGEKLAGQVLLVHLEGGAWNQLVIGRYNSWQDFAATNNTIQAQTLKGSGGWFQIREHLIHHRDTIAHRVAP